jgi:hypothetical protein
MLDALSRPSPDFPSTTPDFTAAVSQNMMGWGGVTNAFVSAQSLSPPSPAFKQQAAQKMTEAQLPQAIATDDLVTIYAQALETHDTATQNTKGFFQLFNTASDEPLPKPVTPLYVKNKVQEFSTSLNNASKFHQDKYTTSLLEVRQAYINANLSWKELINKLEIILLLHQQNPEGNADIISALTSFLDDENRGVANLLLLSRKMMSALGLE